MNIDQIKRLERAGSTFTHGAAPGSDDETDHPGFPVPVIIRCPKCESLCAARIEFKTWMPWPAYVHECGYCGYTITESEWEIASAKGPNK